MTQAQGGLVTIDPPLAQAVQVSDPVTRLDSFTPFGTVGTLARNLQVHAVYIGSQSLLDLPTGATIGINGISDTSISWFYWGKQGNGTAIGWQQLTPVPGAPILTLSKTAGSVEVLTLNGKSSRWLKGTVPAPLSLSAPNISLTINPENCGRYARLAHRFRRRVAAADARGARWHGQHHAARAQRAVLPARP